MCGHGLDRFPLGDHPVARENQEDQDTLRPYKAGDGRRYHGEAPVEDTTREQSYKLFYLKNLAIRFSRDSGALPRSRFLRYVLNSGGDVFTSAREFVNVRKWVEVNRYRFKQDARSVTELWESPE